MRIILLATLLTLASCSDDPTGPVFPEFEGTYAYAATVNGEPDLSAVGTLSLQNQTGSAVTASHTITFRSGGVVVLTLVTTVPGPAAITEDGDISWDQSGTVNLFGTNYGYQLNHDGELSGNRITGTWTMAFSDGSADAGSFTATR